MIRHRIINGKALTKTLLFLFLILSFIIITHMETAKGQDLNTDGYLDIVFSNYWDGKTRNLDSYIYWGSSTGFDINMRSGLPTHGARDNSIADLNNDGYPDIIFSNYGNNNTSNIDSYIYWGSATGFSPNRRTGLPTQGAFGNSVGDLNNDGYLDIVFSNHWNDQSHNINSYIYWGSAMGFDPNIRTELPTLGATINSVADMNNDGYLDIIFANFYKGGTYNYFGGTFNINSYIYWGSAMGFSPNIRTELPTHGAHTTSVGDLNNDGYLDIIFSNHCDGITGEIDSFIYWGSATGFFPGNRTGLPTRGATGNSIADLNNDGYMDIIFSNYNYAGNTRVLDAYIYWGSSEGYALNNKTTLSNPGGQGSIVSDMNYDGYPDIIFCNYYNDTTHKINSYIYWGSAYGFNPDIRTELPTLGGYTVNAGDIGANHKSTPDTINIYPGGSIQEAINSANHGDTIIIHPGIYSENINFSGLAITVKSTDPNDPSVMVSTIIDGSQNGSVVTFDSGEKNDSTLIGLTLKNGKAAYGGGIYCGSGSSPKIINCIISKNLGTTDGGGIYCDEYSSPAISDCTIIGNAVPNFIACQYKTNSEFNHGGGIYFRDCSIPTVTNCDISDNSVSSHGGGIYCRPNSRVRLIDCKLSRNSAYRGGGISYWKCSPTISNCIFSDNSASGHNGGGGGIYSYHSSSAKITNCVIEGNKAYSTTNYALGGGIRCSCCMPTITNCTIVGNSASYTGGAMYLYDTPAFIANCIIWDNSQQEIVGPSTVKVIYSDIQQDGYSDPNLNNINKDPLFIDPYGDLHLKVNSPCIDSALNSGAPANDKDGLTRPQDGDWDGLAKCDMGAYEFVPGDKPGDLKILWQIGYPHGIENMNDLAQEFPKNGIFSQAFDYYVGTDPDPINNPSMPGHLWSKNPCSPDINFNLYDPSIYSMPFGPCFDTSSEINIHFTLDHDYSYGELFLIYDRAGSENDKLSIDGNSIASVHGPGEEEFQRFIFPLSFITSGHHIITLSYDHGGNDNGHYIDCIQLSTEPSPPVLKPNILKITSTGLDLGEKYINKSDVIIGISDFAQGIPIPSPPPSYTAFMRIQDLSPPLNYYFQDIRQEGDPQEKWLMNIDIPEEIIKTFPETYYPLLSWDPNVIYTTGYFKLWASNADGALLSLLVSDMSQTSGYQTKDGDGHYFCVVWAEVISVNMYLRAGWNMISLPVDTKNNKIKTLFPNAEAVFEFNGMYVHKGCNDLLEIGKGYWLYVPDVITYTLTGIPIDNYHVENASSGWSMIGSCSYPSLPAVDNGSIVAVFGFTDRYVFYGSDNKFNPMEQGRGFWINLSDRANLIVSGNK